MPVTFSKNAAALASLLREHFGACAAGATLGTEALIGLWGNRHPHALYPAAQELEARDMIRVEHRREASAVVRPEFGMQNVASIMLLDSLPKHSVFPSSG